MFVRFPKLFEVVVCPGSPRLDELNEVAVLVIDVVHALRTVWVNFISALIVPSGAFFRRGRGYGA